MRRGEVALSIAASGQERVDSARETSNCGEMDPEFSSQSTHQLVNTGKTTE